MAFPFLFYGQDSGSLIYYYSKVLTQFKNPYVISRDVSGNPYLVYDDAESLSQGFTLERNVNYQVDLSGDFFGNIDESIYGFSINSGEVKPGYNDISYFSIAPSGQVSGIPLDLPTFSVVVSGQITGVPLDSPYFSAEINSGVCTGILIESSNYGISLSGESISGILIESSNYTYRFSGTVQKIYFDKMNFNFAFTGGSVQKASIVFTEDQSELMSLGFSFEGGLIAGPIS